MPLFLYQKNTIINLFIINKNILYYKYNFRNDEFIFVEDKMTKQDKTIFVAGVTRNQGKAVANKLIKNGWKVKGLTRNRANAKNHPLKNKIEFVEGDLNNINSFREHLKNVYGVFSVQNFWEHGYDAEVAQGRNLAEAAKDAGIKHFIFSSVASANKNTGLPHFESKIEIEQFIKQIDLPYTILRPVFFMENFFRMKNDILDGRIVNAVESHTPLQMISVENIGDFTLEAFNNPDIFLHKEIDIAGDSLTLTEVAKIFSQTLKHPVEYIEMNLNDFEEFAGKEFALMVNWFNKEGYDVDINSLKENFDIELITFKNWLEKHKKDFTEVKQYK